MNHRRITSRRRRGSATARRGWAAWATAVGMVIFAGSQAYADPILFLNPDGPDRFNWAGDGSVQSWLDITQPWYEQPGVPSGASTVNQEALLHLGRLAGEPSAVAFHIAGVDDLPLLAPVAAIPYGGDPNEFTWNWFGLSFYDGLGSLLPEGEEVSIGMRFDLGDGYRYGWIGVVRTGTALDAFAWGYDTDPGVVPYSPSVPEPGTLTLLALGAVGATARRRLGAYS